MQAVSSLLSILSVVGQGPCSKAEGRQELSHIGDKDKDSGLI